ncbi:MAG: hypothetical protein EOO36_15120 [Cytophagaceae bacterium]|nr:MAG: hypothetical protein EOO36_15120 [Cytophagaceae bacterium]
MRYLLFFLGLALLAGCGDNRANTGQRLDFVGNTRLTSSNKTGLGPADTVASRVYGIAADNELLTRLRITVKYSPRRNPFVYPAPVSALVRDSIDKNPDPDFIYLDTLVNKKDFLFTSVFGVRTTSGTERWQYELRDASDAVRASRAFSLSVRRSDSLLTYQDYTLKLPVPAKDTVGARRFLQLRAGLALPAYTVLGNTVAGNTVATKVAVVPSSAQGALQSLTDLIVLPDGLTLVAPTNPTSGTFRLDATRWPAANRRDTRIYRTGQTATTFANQTTVANIKGIYDAAASTATAGSLGKSIGPVATGDVYAFKTGEATPRYGLLLVVSVPTSTATTNTVGLQLEVRMAK